MESVLNFLNSLDLKDETLVVACSGGSDSMFLLDLLNNLGYKVIKLEKKVIKNTYLLKIIV